MGTVGIVVRAPGSMWACSSQNEIHFFPESLEVMYGGGAKTRGHTQNTKAEVFSLGPSGKAVVQKNIKNGGKANKLFLWKMSI